MISEYQENKCKSQVENNCSYFRSSCTNRVAVFHNLFALIYRQPMGRQNSANNFLLFKYFWNSLLNCFLEKYTFKTCQIIAMKMNDSMLEKKQTYFFQHPVRNVLKKFKINQVFITQKFFPQQNFFNHENCNMKFILSTFSDQITMPQTSFEIYASFMSN